MIRMKLFRTKLKNTELDVICEHFTCLHRSQYHQLIVSNIKKVRATPALLPMLVAEYKKYPNRDRLIKIIDLLALSAPGADKALIDSLPQFPHLQAILQQYQPGLSVFERFKIMHHYYHKDAPPSLEKITALTLLAKPQNRPLSSHLQSVISDVYQLCLEYFIPSDLMPGADYYGLTQVCAEHPRSFAVR